VAQLPHDDRYSGRVAWHTSSSQALQDLASSHDREEPPRPQTTHTHNAATLLESLGAAQKKPSDVRLDGCLEYGAPLPRAAGEGGEASDGGVGNDGDNGGGGGAAAAAAAGGDASSAAGGDDAFARGYEGRLTVCFFLPPAQCKCDATKRGTRWNNANLCDRYLGTTSWTRPGNGSYLLVLEGGKSLYGASSLPSM